MKFAYMHTYNTLNKVETEAKNLLARLQAMFYVSVIVIWTYLQAAVGRNKNSPNRNNFKVR